MIIELLLLLRDPGSYAATWVDGELVIRRLEELPSKAKVIGGRRGTSKQAG